MDRHRENATLYLGGVHSEGGGEVEPYRLVLALVQAAEKVGATIRHGSVVGLRSEGGRVNRVVLENDEIACENVVLAMGPWSSEASSWLNMPVPVTPLKGQILRLQAPGAPFQCALNWSGNYATSKPDGLLWAGTTEEDVGFNDTPTTEARDKIMASLLKMVPSMTEARLAQHTACLRPLSADGLLLLGKAPGWEGVYLATGAGRQGIMLGPAMARITVDLITKGATDLPIADFDPARFAAKQ
ncbi:MAG: FAD-dependent oxidoreductase [Chloroflexi bacterium]|nr:FAD-dependent oxidoreductase [Chloroflexota bacterium]